MKLSVALFLLLSIDDAFLADARSPKRVRQRNRQRGLQQQERRTKGNEGKGKGSSGEETDPPTDGATGAPVSNDFDEISNDGSHLDLICGIFQSYNDLVLAGSSNADFCSAFDTEKSLLCPNDYELGKICEGVQLGLDLSVSITEQYCAPIFDELYYDAVMKADCVDYCASFVDEGDCCDLTCN